MKKIFLICMFITSSQAHAELQKNYTLSLDAANKFASNIMEACVVTAKPAAVVVLDQGGNVLVSQRHETVGIHNLIAAQRKAFTAYSTKTSTYQFMKNAQNNKDAENLNTLPELLLLGGGVPIIYKNQLIGAVGVAGAGGSIQDDQCAQKGIEQTLKHI
jgi:uncharacterized protein GlcG (DUF336 family)